MARISKLPVIEDVERLSLEFERSSLPKFRGLLKSYIRFPNIGSAHNSVSRVSEMSINAARVLWRLYESRDINPIAWILVRRNNQNAGNNVGPLVRSGITERHLSRIQANRDSQGGGPCETHVIRSSSS